MHKSSSPPVIFPVHCVKMWELGVRGKMWRVIKEMYRVSRSAVLLDGECSEAFDVQQGVAQG